VLGVRGGEDHLDPELRGGLRHLQPRSGAHLDVEQGQVDTGTKVRMAFRIKDFDPKRGFVRYFSKAVPI